MLYFDNAYPLKMGWMDIRYTLLRPGWKSLERKAKHDLVPPESGMPFHFKIGGIEPRCVEALYTPIIHAKFIPAYACLSLAVKTRSDNRLSTVNHSLSV